MNRKGYACTMIVSSSLLIYCLSAFNGLDDGGAYPFDPTGLGATFASGNGTISDPYQISNVFELQNISFDLKAHYVLASDINASTTVNWNSGAGFESIGGSDGIFKGILDGRNHTIAGLFINRPSTDYVGLFRYILGGSVMNVGLVDSNITAHGDVGGLAGIGAGTISNSYYDGQVNGLSSVGGLVGYGFQGAIDRSHSAGSVQGTGLYIGGLIGSSDGMTVNNSFTNVNVQGHNYVGGLIGNNGQTNVSNSYATGNVHGDLCIGGLMGWAGDSTVLSCYSTGSVSGTESHVGGLIGSSSNCIISSSYATGNVDGGFNYVGGLMGTSMNRAVIESHASGNVRGTRFVGGLIGRNSPQVGTIIDCYATGNVDGSRGIGGLVGSMERGIITNSHYNIDDVSLNGGHPITIGGLLDSQYDDWFSNNLSLDISDYETSLVPSGDHFTIDDPQGLGQLLGFADVESYRFHLGDDMDLSMTPDLWIPYLDAEFDGDNHTISNLSIDLPSVAQVGLIGYVARGIVKNIGLIENNVTGGHHVGGLVGCNFQGTISNAYATGIVTNKNGICTGGLIGLNVEGIITDAYANGTVRGPGRVGGFLGWKLSGKISNSYSTSDLPSTGNAIGGFVGSCGSSNIFNCFWDMEASGVDHSEGGTGKTTAEMKTLSTFTDAGWDFNDTWCILENLTYPLLRWQDAEPPTASAGPDQTVSEGTLVTFDGSGSHNDAAMAFVWTFEDVLPVTVHGIRPEYLFKNPGSFPVTLNVTDAIGNWDTDVMVVTVNDVTAPAANAGLDQTVDEGTLVTFDGSASSDNIGVVDFSWTFMDGAPITLHGHRPSHRFDNPGIFVVTLNITDAAGNWRTDTMTVTVRDITPPAADAGPDQTVDEGTLVTFDSSGSSDNVGIVNWTWSFYYFILFPEDEPYRLYGETSHFMFDNPGIYMVRLTVRDAAGHNSSDTTNVTVNDVNPPLANAGPDQTVDEGTVVKFYGGNSHDSGGIGNFTWTFKYGTEEVALYERWASFTFDIPGTYVITLKVTDYAGHSSTDTLNVTVIDIVPPMVDAGPDRTVDTGDLVTFDGSGSQDDGGIVNYTWSFDLGTGTVLLYGVTPSFTFNVPGVFIVTLNVTDAAGHCQGDTMMLTVNDVTAPVADAGPDQRVPVGSVVSLTSSASTDNVGITAYTWSFTHDGQARTLEGAATQFTFDRAGVYEVTLTIADAAGNLDNDTVVITVVGTGTVTGTVLDKGGKPVEGATVEVTAADGRAYNATTAANGSFALDVPHGAFTWKVSKKGYKTASGSSSVDAMGTSELEFSDKPLVKEDKKSPGAGLVIIVFSMMLATLIAASRRRS